METNTQMELANENQNPIGMGQWKPKPQLTHKKQRNFTICIYVYSQASLWIQTKINKYAKFVNYIASLHTTKKKSSRIHVFPKIHKQTW